MIPEGLSGRTTCHDDHASFAGFNGTMALPMLLATHTLLDLVVIMLVGDTSNIHSCGSPGARGWSALQHAREVFLVVDADATPSFPVRRCCHEQADCLYCAYNYRFRNMARDTALLVVDGRVAGLSQLRHCQPPPERFS